MIFDKDKLNQFVFKGFKCVQWANYNGQLLMVSNRFSIPMVTFASQMFDASQKSQKLTHFTKFVVTSEWAISELLFVSVSK